MRISGLEHPRKREQPVQRHWSESKSEIFDEQHASSVAGVD